VGSFFKAALAGTFFAVAACRQIERVKAESKPALSQSDQDFIIETELLASRDHALGTFVKDKSASGEIQRYAQTVIQDDSEALQKLKDLIQKHEIKEPPAGEQFRDAAQLKSLWRKGLDRQFVSLMIQDDENAIAIFREEVESPANPDLRTYASNLLPALQRELKQGRDLQKKVSMDGATQVRVLKRKHSQVSPSF
jgi:putative membrane protein